MLLGHGETGEIPVRARRRNCLKLIGLSFAAKREKPLKLCFEKATDAVQKSKYPIRNADPKGKPPCECQGIGLTKI